MKPKPKPQPKPKTPPPKAKKPAATAVKRAYVKPTDAVREERIHHIMQLVAQAPSTTLFKLNHIYGKKWKVPSTTMSDYLVAAKQELKKRLYQGKEEFQSQAVNFYESIRDNWREDTANRIRAQALLLNLVGADTPTPDLPQLPAPGTTTQTITEEARKMIQTMGVDQLQALLQKMEEPPLEIEATAVVLPPAGDNKA